jgi:hypothetical protein
MFKFIKSLFSSTTPQETIAEILTPPPRVNESTAGAVKPSAPTNAKPTPPPSQIRKEHQAPTKVRAVSSPAGEKPVARRKPRKPKTANHSATNKKPANKK